MSGIFLASVVFVIANLFLFIPYTKGTQQLLSNCPFAVLLSGNEHTTCTAVSFNHQFVLCTSVIHSSCIRFSANTGASAASAAVVPPYWQPRSFAGIRVGEASHPGPRQSLKKENPSQVNIAIVNPTAIAKKSDTFADLNSSSIRTAISSACQRQQQLPMYSNPSRSRFDLRGPSVFGRHQCHPSVPQ